MKKFKFSFSTIMLSLFLTLSQLNAFENASIERRISDFREAISNNDWDGIVSVLPPRLLKTMAKNFDLEVDVLIAAIKEQTKNSMTSVSIVSFELDLENAIKNQSASGRIYLLIPTTTVLKTEKSKLLGESHTLAFVDDEVWYLIRLGDGAQIMFVKEAYPEFENVNFPEGTINLVE